MPKYYLLDENKNLVEGFDKEGFLALLEQAIDQGSLENIDEDSAVASKIRSVLNGTTHHIEFVTQAQFNQLEAEGKLVANTYYFITDDTTAEDLEGAIETLQEDLEEEKNTRTQLVSDLLDGQMQVGRAVVSDRAVVTPITHNSWSSVALNGSNVIPFEYGAIYLFYVHKSENAQYGLNFGLCITLSNPSAIDNWVHVGTLVQNLTNENYSLYIEVTFPLVGTAIPHLRKYSGSGWVDETSGDYILYYKRIY